MSDAVRCSKCGYVYWTRSYENWGTCDKCNFNNDVWIDEDDDNQIFPLLVHSSVIFQTIPYNLEKWGYLNPGIKKTQKEEV